MNFTKKRIRLASPYIKGDNGKSFGLYKVSVTFSNGERKMFDSEEQADAFLEKRKVDKTALLNEVPQGFPKVDADKLNL